MRFTVFNRLNTPTLRSNHITALTKTRDGALWIGTDSGLIRYLAGAFVPFTKADGLSSAAILSLAIDAGDNVWVGTSAGLSHSLKGPSVRFASSAVLNGLPVSGQLHSRDGRTWVIVGGTLYQLVGESLKKITFPDAIGNRTATTIYEDASGNIWIGTNAGLFDLSGDQALSVGDASRNVQTMLADRDGNLWIGEGGGGLTRWRGGESESLTSKEGFASDIVNSLYEDHENNLWVGTLNGGLVSLHDGKFTPFGPPEGLSYNTTHAVLEDHAGSMWIGTGNGLDRVSRDGGITTYGTREGLSNRRVLSLAEDWDGNMWVGTLRGLNVLRNDRVTPIIPPPSIRIDTVTALLIEGSADLWVGTNTGLLRYRHGQFTRVDGIAGMPILTLYRDRSGDVLVGTRGAGMARYHDGVFQWATTYDGLSDNSVTALYQDSAGTLWIGTGEGGLNAWNDGKFTAFRERDGLFDDSISAILDDGAGNLWMSSARGVWHVRKANLKSVAAGETRTIVSVAYGLGDGMRSISAAGNGDANPAGWRARDGRLWFPTLRGVVSIDPTAIQINPVPPPVILENVLVNGHPAEARCDACGRVR